MGSLTRRLRKKDMWVCKVQPKYSSAYNSWLQDWAGVRVMGGGLPLGAATADMTRAAIAAGHRSGKTEMTKALMRLLKEKP